MIRDKIYFTKLMKTRGWSVSSALRYWGRSYDWYHRNCKGGDDEHNRLECMCDGLPMTEDAKAEANIMIEHLKTLCGIAGSTP